MTSHITRIVALAALLLSVTCASARKPLYQCRWQPQNLHGGATIEKVGKMPVLHLAGNRNRLK